MKIYKITDSADVIHWVAAYGEKRAEEALLRHFQEIRAEESLPGKLWKVEEMPDDHTFTQKFEVGDPITLTCEEWGRIYDLQDIAQDEPYQYGQAFYLACSEH